MIPVIKKLNLSLQLKAQIENQEFIKVTKSFKLNQEYLVKIFLTKQLIVNVAKKRKNNH